MVNRHEDGEGTYGVGGVAISVKSDEYFDF
jgi:hypothetical protein